MNLPESAPIRFPMGHCANRAAWPPMGRAWAGEGGAGRHQDPVVRRVNGVPGVSFGSPLRRQQMIWGSPECVLHLDENMRTWSMLGAETDAENLWAASILIYISFSTASILR